MSNKVTSRSYSYFPHFLPLIFWEKRFFQSSTKLPSFVQKPQRILGVNIEIVVAISQVFLDINEVFLAINQEILAII
jgi:hypothetical protein